jgi:putative membrane protein insertion efficiency factor
MSATLPSASTGDARLPASELVHFLPLVPRNAALSLLHGYRATISHTYGDVCKYYPSCSAYAVGAVQQHGVMRGSAMAAARIARCHPWAKGGIDDVPPHKSFKYDLTPHGYVVPVSPRKD